jgi:glycine/D-amino acid oxidase-like deaminating enzyme
VNSPRFLGGWHEPRCGLIDPAKLVRELKRVVEARGGAVFEQTPVEEVNRVEGGFHLHTRGGLVRADRVVFATNGWSGRFPQLRRRQMPAFTHVVVTEPLSAAQREAIGWAGRQGLEDARNMIHYFRLTPDDRILIGGNDVTLPFGRGMQHDLNARVFARLEARLARMFPALGEVRVADRWGGPVSVPLDMVPAIGFVGDRRAVYSLGCMGHGVSLTHLNGKTIADLLLERDTELTRTWFVGRRVLPWPPEPLRFVAASAVRAALRLQDALQGG